MTIAEARAALIVPAHLRNNNCVQAAQSRLREEIALATNPRVIPLADTDRAPDYVVKAVRDLRSWL
jgi:hypothetical protein